MIYQFGEMEFDRDNFRLRRNGETIKLEPQVFDVLRYLIEHRDRVVTRQELLDTLWDGKIVSDATLSNHIKMARAAVGDDGESQRVIKTVRGRGYQFVAQVRQKALSEVTEPAPAKDNMKTILTRPKRVFLSLIGVIAIVILGMGFLLKMTAPTPQLNQPVNPLDASIAILPFDNLSESDDDQYFAEGVHHDLLMQVANIRDIRTISRTSVYLYRDSEKSIPTIANELGVSTVLEGAVQRAGQEVRVNVQLVDGASDELMWAQSYTRALTAENLFAIQGEIAGAIAEALAAALSPAEKRAISTYSTENINALEAYFLAQAAMSKNNNAGFQLAIQHLHTALELDEDFALAYAVLAQLYLDQIYWSGAPPAQQLSLASPLLQRALSLNPNLSEAHAALASLQEYQGQYSAALESYSKAIQYKPNNDKVYAALGRFYLWVERDLEASVGYFNQALKLNPRDNLLKENLTEALIRRGRFEEAQTLVDDMLEEDPEFAAAYRAMADIEAWKNKNLSAAQAHLHKAIELAPNVPSYTLKLALRYLDLGQDENALYWLKNTVKLTPSNHSSQFAVALIDYIEGRPSQAFETFLRVPKYSPYFSQSLGFLLNIGLGHQSHQQLERHFMAMLPELYSSTPLVSPRNYVSAFLLARLLQVNGNQAQAQELLERSLYYAKKDPIGDWQGQHRDWRTKIYIAMEDKANALNSYANWVAAGYASATVDGDPIYEYAVSDNKCNLINEGAGW